MASKRPPKKLYPLEEIATERGWNVSELHVYAKEDNLEICKLIEYSDRAIPLTAGEAALLTYDPIAYCVRNGIRSLVITHEEKMRFDKEYPISESELQDEQHKDQANVTKKITTEELRLIAQKLQKAERDQDVVAARLYDEYGARDHQLVKILNIAPHLTSETSEDPEGSRNKAAWRAVKKGRETIAARAVVK